MNKKKLTKIERDTHPITYHYNVVPAGEGLYSIRTVEIQNEKVMSSYLSTPDLKSLVLSRIKRLILQDLGV